MQTYTRELLDKYKYKFSGIEKIDKNYSQAYQDMFVLSVLNGKETGSFLEIGSYDPTILSNTYLLESVFNWNGISIDTNPLYNKKMIDYPRKCSSMLGDATKTNWFDVLKGKTRIDYLSLDIEPNYQTYSCLVMLMAIPCRYSVITYETDLYANFEYNNFPCVREMSRLILEQNGYVLVANDVSGFGDDEHPFEDWYVDKFMGDEVVSRFKSIRETPIAAHKLFYD